MSLKSHRQTMQHLNGASAEAGWFDTAKYPDGTQIAHVAATLDLGTATMVARPFVREASKSAQPGAAAIAKKGVVSLAEGKETVQQVMGLIGLHLEAEIIKSVKNGAWAANAPSTIARKGFNKPLIDTALMWQTVSSKTSLKGDSE